MIQARVVPHLTEAKGACEDRDVGCNRHLASTIKSSHAPLTLWAFFVGEPRDLFG